MCSSVTRTRESALNRHHLTVHGERAIGQTTTTELIVSQGAKIVLQRLTILDNLLVLGLSLLLESDYGRAGRRASSKPPSLQSTPTVETRLVIIVAFADDLSTTHNDAAMAVVQARQ